MAIIHWDPYEESNSAAGLCSMRRIKGSLDAAGIKLDYGQIRALLPPPDVTMPCTSHPPGVAGPVGHVMPLWKPETLADRARQLGWGESVLVARASAVSGSVLNEDEKLWEAELDW